MEAGPKEEPAKSLRLETAALISGTVAGVGAFIEVRPPRTETQAASLGYEAEGVASALLAAIVLLGVTCAVRNRLRSRSA